MRTTRLIALVAAVTFSCTGFSQTNVVLTPNIAEQVLLGNYNVNQYAPTQVIDLREDIIQGMVARISADTLKTYLEVLGSFETRNTGSDTVSSTRGIGAARRWIKTKFDQYSAANENRLIVGYLDFDEVVCGMDHHRNVYAMLPGLDANRSDFLLVEAHVDSRCEGRCDTACLAEGMEDNASGTALVMELARVMSAYAFDRTIVFTAVTGEEQGLVGGDAWSGYIKSLNVPFMACLNNDVVGGVYCGFTSSPPSCPNPNEIDSTNARIFSFSPLNDSNFASPHKQLARYVKLQQIEEINPRIATPMNINLQIREDREGRGGDHIPFREKGFTAIRFCAQNEHGDGSGTPPDRQHSVNDILGVDTDNDNEIDSFFVDFNYLQRNTLMNAVNLGLLANSPPIPQQPVSVETPVGIELYLDAADQVYPKHRVGIRRHGSGSLYFDRVEDYQNTNKLIIDNLIPGQTYSFSVMNVDDDDVESLFTEEFTSLVTGIETPQSGEGLVLLPGGPNPARNETEVLVQVWGSAAQSTMSLVLTDMLGQRIQEQAIKLQAGVNRFPISLEGVAQGAYHVTLLENGQPRESIKLLVSK